MQIILYLLSILINELDIIFNWCIFEFEKVEPSLLIYD